MLSLLAAKGLVLGVLFVMTCILGLVPVKLMTFIQRSTAAAGGRGPGQLAGYKRVLSLLSCFAAGVFLATCFLDLLPGVRKKLMTVLFKMNITSGFPLAEFIMASGLFVILIVEQIVLMVKERRADLDQKRPLLSTANEGRAGSEQDKADFLQSDHSITGISDQPYSESDSCERERPVQCRESGRPRSDSHHHHHHHHDDLQSHSPLRALLMLLALSLHSVFEGLAVGLQGSAGQVLGVFAALVLHKSILSFSLGLSLVQSRLSTAVCLKSVLCFSLASPLGVGVGMLVTDFWASTASGLVDGILTGIASGTFLYVTFFEMLPAEFNSPHDRMLKLLMLLLGFSAVTGVLFLSDDVKAPFCKISGDN